MREVGNGMTDKRNFRLERIEKLLHELRYEIERGLVSNEIPEEIGFQFIHPISRKIPNGCVVFDLMMRPRMSWLHCSYQEPKLKLVWDKKE